MITIGNQLTQTQTLLKDYPQSSLESIILTALGDSSSSFRYQSIDQLKFELALRRAIVQAAVDLNNSDFSFAVFRKSKGNPTYWERVSNGGLRLKQGAKPSDAIKDIYVNGKLYASECATAMIIVYLKALLSVYPEPLFNEAFSDITLMNWHHIPRLLSDVGQMQPATVYLPGDRRYFANPDVDPVTPEWQGENTIDLSKDFYYGHGVGIYNAEEIISELNKNRKRDSNKEAYLMDSAGRPDFKKLANIYLTYKKEHSNE
ncbi:protein-glutamine gamma-glutamyltransferase [Paludicola sp. MB14-C6]|uniref:protein-glutamine gamma-glutamyltransferase n=1 Tax=Paludihabitans sp. MB14-C6 TaxID=3070656 RepID=UPI0027DE90AE|nr:protein-glutamine gamma-glutamyltransferase [Paludicola sp. MB14-C6]WMJ23864.1 protein-glutamine gamma-glutamyltransferase [Paludicola sp. MB14-C6]